MTQQKETRAVRYSTWQDHATKTYEVVMWDGRHPMVIKFGIKSADRARKIAAQYQARERAALAKTGGAK